MVPRGQSIKTIPPDRTFLHDNVKSITADFKEVLWVYFENLVKRHGCTFSLDRKFEILVIVVCYLIGLL